MYKIEAFVRRSVGEQVRDALTRHGVEGVTTDLAAASPAGAPPAFYRGAPYVAEVLQNKVERVVADADVTAVVQAIVAAARTPGSVDGRILILPITDLIPIATNWRGTASERPRLTKGPGPRRLGVDARPVRNGPAATRRDAALNVREDDR
jgi:nitrogen regulatory protein PII